jgi:hypothetical protein
VQFDICIRSCVKIIAMKGITKSQKIEKKHKKETRKLSIERVLKQKGKWCGPVVWGQLDQSFLC